MNTSTGKRNTRIENPSHGVVTIAFTGNTVRVAKEVLQVAEDNPNKGDDSSDDKVKEDSDDEVSLYSCNYCHNFGPGGLPCGRCVEDSACYFVGDKMTEEKITEAFRLMEEEDEEEATGEESEDE